MINYLYGLDVALLQQINLHWTSEWLDRFFLLITNLHKFDTVRFGLFPLLLGLAFWRARWGAVRAAVVMGLTVGACDLVNHRVVKEWLERPRPFHETSLGVELKLGFEPGGYSFPSNHAMNTMAAARLLGAYIPPMGMGVFVYALLVGYSRPYLGAHYPSDVLGGWILGWLVASIVLWLLRRFVPRWAPGQTQVRK